MRTSRTIQRIAYDRCVRARLPFGALGLLSVVAACNPPGLTIEVVIDDPAIAKVELFAGRGCGECPVATAPPGLPRMLVDAGYIVDDPEPFTVTKNELSNGVAGFRIEADQDETLAILVALAYDAQGQVRWSWTGHGVQIPNGDSVRWRIEMSPTTPIDANLAPQPNTERIAEWPHPKGRPSCLLLEHWDDSSQAKREMLSPVDDFDCDNVDPMYECEKFIPNAMGVAPNLDSANCVTPVTDPAGYVCMLGGPQCTEIATAPRDGCVPLETPYCTSLTLCQCAGKPDAAGCIRNLIVTGTTDMPSMPFMKCSIGVDASGNRCDNNDLFLDAGAFLGSSSPRVCKDLRLNDGEAPLGSFDNKLLIGTTAKLIFENFTQPCRTNVRFEGSQTAPQVEYGFLDVEIDNGYHLVVPARIDVHLGCINPSVCGVSTISSDTSETIFKCAGAESITPLCGPDQAHGCEGPWCNGACCGYGEQCTANGCSCAGSSRCSGTDTCQAGLPSNDFCGSLCCGPGNPCPF